MYFLDNPLYHIELANDGNSLSLTDKNTGHVWSSVNPFFMRYGNYYDYNIADHAEIAVMQSATRLDIRFTKFSWWATGKNNPYHKPDPGPEIILSFHIELRGNMVSFSADEIQNMDDEDYQIAFPHKLLAWDSSLEGGALIPWGYGAMFDFPRSDMFEYRYSYPFCNNSMPFYAMMLRRDGALAVRDAEPFDSVTHLAINVEDRRRSSCGTIWLFNRRFANYRRELQVRAFGPEASYVTIAKWYRSLMIAEGRFKSLETKIAESPEVEKLVGAVIWKHCAYPCRTLPPGIKPVPAFLAGNGDKTPLLGLASDRSAYDLFEQAKKAGFDRVCIYNAGWNKGGYDKEYPTRLPPNPALGSTDDFKNAAEYARSLSPGYIYSVHDNYHDAYDDSPEVYTHNLARTKDGAPLYGGVWRGGRAKLLCTSKSMEYAKRDIPQMVKIFGRGSIYIDVFGAADLTTCYDGEHPLSRRGDAEARREVFTYIRSQFGSVATESSPADYLADVVDAGAYFPYAGQALYPRAIERKPFAVPLWQLVWHDSVLGTNFEGIDGISGNDYLCMTALYGLLPGAFDPVSLKISKEMRKTFTSEMLSHEILTPVVDSFYCVARTSFADGTQVTANLTDRPFEIDGSVIPPHDFVIRKIHQN